MKKNSTVFLHLISLSSIFKNPGSGGPGNMENRAEPDDVSVIKNGKVAIPSREILVSADHILLDQQCFKKIYSSMGKPIMLRGAAWSPDIFQRHSKKREEQELKLVRI
jgi:hypothetical protein